MNETTFTREKTRVVSLSELDEIPEEYEGFTTKWRKSNYYLYHPTIDGEVRGNRIEQVNLKIEELFRLAHEKPDKRINLLVSDGASTTKVKAKNVAVKVKVKEEVV